jgi:hypothetical protein
MEEVLLRVSPRVLLFKIYFFTRTKMPVFFAVRL